MYGHPLRFSYTENSLIRLCKDQQYRSLSELQKILSLSSEEILKIIDKLSNYGIRINGDKNLGFKIQDRLQQLDVDDLDFQNIKSDIMFEYYDSIKSTNDYLLFKSEKYDNSVVYSEFQQNGKGRNGKEFKSLYGQHLLFSVGCFFTDLKQLSGLSIAVGIAISKALNEYGFDNKIKWPNDIYLGNCKVCGVLIESVTHSDKVWAVIGVGINISKGINQYMSNFFSAQNVSSLEDCLINRTSTVSSNLFNNDKEIIDKTKLFKIILKEMFSVLQTFKKTGLVSFVDYYQEHSMYFNEMVKLVNNHAEFVGKNLGIDQNGGLILKIGEERKLIPCGEMSLRI